MGKKKSKKDDDIIIDDDVVINEVIEKPKHKKHYVCTPVTSKKGILKKGECICENDLAGGKDALDKLLKKGIVEYR